MGIATYSRKCPKCGKYIFVGDQVRAQVVSGRKGWVHEACWMPGKLQAEIKILDREFRRTVQ